MSHKVEAQTLRITANNQGYQVKGDVRIAGTPAADRISQAARRDRMRSSACRRRSTTRRATVSAFDLAGHGHRTGAGARLSGKITPRPRPGQPLRRRCRSHPGEDRQSDARLVEAGRQAARASFNYIGKPKSTRLEDIVIEGQRHVGQGQGRNRCQRRRARRPICRCSRCPTATRRRCGPSARPTGMLRVVMRGEVFDGRGFVKIVDGRTSARAAKPRAWPTSISTSRSARSPASTARRCARSTSGSSAATAPCAASL